jgi:hypothetical protein
MAGAPKVLFKSMMSRDRVNNAKSHINLKTIITAYPLYTSQKAEEYSQ